MNSSIAARTLLQQLSVDDPIYLEVRPSLVAVGIIMSIVIIVGNSLVLLLFYQERRSLKIAHKYIISMALCDMGVGVLGIPTEVYTLHKNVPSSSHDCQWIMGLHAALIQTSLTILVASSIDRYWAVRFPHHYRHSAKNLVANCIIIASWCIPCSFGLICYLTALTSTNDIVCIMGTETYNPILFRFLVYGFMPINLILIVLFYVLIYREMTKLFRTTNTEMGTKDLVKMIFQQQKTEKGTKYGAITIREARTTFLLLITVTLAMIAFIPGTAIGYVMAYDPTLVPVKTLLICFMLFSANSLFNPFIYAFNIGNVREAAHRLWERLVLFKHAEVDREMTSTSATGESSQAKIVKQEQKHDI